MRGEVNRYHGRPITFRSGSNSRPRNQYEKNIIIRAIFDGSAGASPRLPLKAKQLALSRRSSVVERSLHKAMVGSSILPAGTSKNENFAHAKFRFSPYRKTVPRSGTLETEGF